MRMITIQSWLGRGTNARAMDRDGLRARVGEEVGACSACIVHGAESDRQNEPAVTAAPTLPPPNTPSAIPCRSLGYQRET
jgi:hypothetical protein